MKKPLVLCIMDGFGLGTDDSVNAIKAAKTTNLSEIMSNNPMTSIEASGLAVGLPDGQMGNSEVGHTNIGAGRIVYQELTRISKSIKDGDFFENKAINDAIDNCKAKNSAFHIMGLLSDGGVHSHIEHIEALVRAAADKGIGDIFIHCFMDGRDVPPTSGIEFIDALEKSLAAIGAGSIATVMGRYYAMDRDNRWERVEKAYKAMVNGIGVSNGSACDAMEKSYGSEVTDEFVKPVVVNEKGMIKSGDSVVFANFRPDRAREITRCFVDPAFDGFERAGGMLNLNFVCLTQYDATMPNVSVAFTPQSLDNTFGEYIAQNGKTQLRIAETEKYAHVTFFFNGGVEAPYENEDRALIPSPKVATYDLQPEMSEPEVTKEVVSRIESGKYDVIILNYANCDMVGHTGIFDAAVSAVEATDHGVGEVYKAVKKMDGVLLITADHGNADRMYEDDGSPFTAHTTNLVPFIVCGVEGAELREGGCLADIAPTMLKILNLPQPQEMTGKSIVL